MGLLRQCIMRTTIDRNTGKKIKEEIIEELPPIDEDEYSEQLANLIWGGYEKILENIRMEEIRNAVHEKA